jgi:radical SAM protein (TIGR01212 family)
MKIKTENPFKNSDSNKRYYTYDYYLRQKYGTKVCKIPLDAGFTCPNIDGTKGVGGCIYCSERGSGDFAASAELSVRQQYDTVIVAQHKKWPDAKCIAYFQAHTNTYAPLDVLKEKFEAALALPDVVGLNIATRADCISDACAEYLHDLAQRCDLCVELGLQSTNDKTAEVINRCHTYGEFLEGYAKLEGIDTCIHIINGLPGENRETMIKTVSDVAKLHPKFLKIHLMHVLKNTRLGDMYESGKYVPMELEDYVSVVCDQLELLPQDTVIGRITGDGAPDALLAPTWSRKKFVVMNEIDKELVRRDSYQGKFVQNAQKT